MLTFTKRLSSSPNLQGLKISFTLHLSAQERTRSRHRWETQAGQSVAIHLPRGTVLRDGDLLQAETETIIRIAAKPEPVLTVTSQTHLDLLRAAYHLGNRHVPLEITPHYLRLAPDPVLENMLIKLGLHLKAEISPFHPETGAYGHNH